MIAAATSSPPLSPPPTSPTACLTCRAARAFRVRTGRVRVTPRACRRRAAGQARERPCNAEYLGAPSHAHEAAQRQPVCPVPAAPSRPHSRDAQEGVGGREGGAGPRPTALDALLIHARPCEGRRSTNTIPTGLESTTSPGRDGCVHCPAGWGKAAGGRPQVQGRGGRLARGPQVARRRASVRVGGRAGPRVGRRSLRAGALSRTALAALLCRPQPHCLRSRHWHRRRPPAPRPARAT